MNSHGYPTLRRILLAAVLLVPQVPYRRMRLMALLLSPAGFLAYNEEELIAKTVDPQIEKTGALAGNVGYLALALALGAVAELVTPSTRTSRPACSRARSSTPTTPSCRCVARRRAWCRSVGSSSMPCRRGRWSAGARSIAPAAPFGNASCTTEVSQLTGTVVEA